MEQPDFGRIEVRVLEYDVMKVFEFWQCNEKCEVWYTVTGLNCGAVNDLNLCSSGPLAREVKSLRGESVIRLKSFKYNSVAWSVIKKQTKQKTKKHKPCHLHDLLESHVVHKSIHFCITMEEANCTYFRTLIACTILHILLQNPFLCQKWQQTSWLSSRHD